MIVPRYQQRTIYEGIYRSLIPDQKQLLWEKWMLKVDALLDDDELIEMVHAALGRRRPKSQTRGRRGTPSEVVLRLIVLKHMKNWSYETLEREVRANLLYRDFTRIGGEAVPDAKTMVRLGQALGPEVTRKIHERVVQLAREEKVTTGRKMRVDTTVVETNIHYPTDSSLLGDGVRVLTRTMKRIEEEVGRGGTRVLKGGTHFKRKILSIVETATEAIRKGKAAKPTEFEKMLKIQESENQIVTDYEIFEERPADQAVLMPSIEKHNEIFDRAPVLVATDAGFYSADNEARAREAGVEKAAIPNKHTRSPARIAHQRQRWFRRAQQWRVGSEGGISVLKRRHGLFRSRYKGSHGMERWVGFGVIAKNLINIARATTK